MSTQSGRLVPMAVTPLSGTVLWTDPRTGRQWAVAVSWQEQGGVPTPVGLRLSSWRDENSETDTLPEYGVDADLPRVDGTVLRRLPVAQLVAASRARLSEILASVAAMSRSHAEMLEALPEELRGDTSTFLADTESQRRSAKALDRFAAAYEAPSRGGRDLGDAHYAEVAAVYRQAVKQGLPPTKAVEQHFQWRRAAPPRRLPWLGSAVSCR